MFLDAKKLDFIDPIIDCIHPLVAFQEKFKLLNGVPWFDPKI